MVKISKIEYEDLSRFRQAEFWLYISDVGYNAGDEVLYGNLTRVFFYALSVEAQAVFWFRYNRDYGFRFIPDPTVPEPAWFAEFDDEIEIEFFSDDSDEDSVSSVPNGFTDQLGTGSVANGPGVTTGLGNHPNIDDPDWGVYNGVIPDGQVAPTKSWETSLLSLGKLPKAEPQRNTCETSCAGLKKQRALKCAVLRKRVAAALKVAGCPSKVSAFAKKKKVCLKKVG